jgi:hypothetical protein
MHRFLLILALLAQVVAYCQHEGIDPKKLDSFARSIDSSQKKMRAWQDSFQHRQDSLYEAAQMDRDLEQNTRNLNSFIASQKEREKKERQQMYWRFAMLGIMVILLVVRLAGRKKKPEISNTEHRTPNNE